jgi:hypothetical protein
MANLSIALVPQVLDLTLYAGDGVNLRLRIKDLSGNPVNLTGIMRAQIRPDRDSVDTPDANFGVDLSDGAEGLVMLTLTGEVTQGLAPTDPYKGVWDLEWTPAGDQPRTICQGSVECLQDVSH